MATLEEQAKPAVSNLLTQSDEDLFSELGARLKALETHPEISGKFDAEVMRLEDLGFVDDFVTKFFARANRQAYELLCASDGKNKAERNDIASKLKLSVDDAGAAIAAFLVANMAMAPAAAAVVAALIVKLVLQNAVTSLCEVWGEYLNPATP